MKHATTPTGTATAGRREWIGLALFLRGQAARTDDEPVGQR
jgi:hypothetical protein